MKDCEQSVVDNNKVSYGYMKTGEGSRTMANGSGADTPSAILLRAMRFLILAWASALALTAAAMPAAATSDLPAFLEKYRCAVIEQLNTIHAQGDRTRQTKRFLILSIAKKPSSYVQCVYFEDDAK